ncbi:MAG: CehA/McbA family metallohydrolase [Planctomycetes bacterium]|nr:CehA/McbA family metallohydrolase [Planctomycetota bacterium]
MPDRAAPGEPEAAAEVSEFQRKEIPDNIADEGGYSLSAVRHIITEGNDDFPAAAIDREDNLWVAWSSYRDGVDTILARRFSPSEASEIMQVSTQRGAEFQPAMAVDNQGRVWVVWSALRKGQWFLLGRSWEGDAFGGEIVLDKSKEGVFAPALCSSAMGWLWLAWERIVSGAPHIAVQTFDGDRWGGVQIISEPSAPCRRPSLTETANGVIWCAWDEWQEGDADIHVRGYTGQAWLASQSITEHAAMDMQPALVGDNEGNLWIAYASNRSGPKSWQVPKWIYVRRFDGRTLYQPAQTQVGRDLTKKKEDQGWEFPRLIMDKGNRLWIFGRASHSFSAQSLSEGGWSDLIHLTPHQWGCRGQRIQPVIDAAGDIWIVSRGLERIEVQRLTPKGEPSGPPKLKAILTSEKKRKLDNIGPDVERCRVEVDGATFNVYFGDLHAQSSHSDAMGDADEFYARCRWVYKLDFAALTDHEEFCMKQLGRGEWNYLCNVASRFSEDGRFVTFCGYEWTGTLHPGPGHMSVIHADPRAEILSRSGPDTDTPAKLLPKLKNAGAIAIPHHIGWTGFDWESFDPEVQPIVEICSIHGAYEYEGNQPIPYRSDNVIPGYFVRDMLNKGLKFGLCACSGGHGLLAHHGMGWKEESYLAGLTAVYAERLTRDSILDAIKKRRCYATSGAKIFLDFRINGHMMGSEIDAEGEIEIAANVVGTYRLNRVEIIRNGDVIHTVRKHKKHLSFTHADTAPPGTSYYYLRVVQNDNEMAWSSPVWVTAPEKAEPPPEEEQTDQTDANQAENQPDDS